VAVIEALFKIATIAEAASKCGVSERTLQRWLAEPEICSQCSAANNRLLKTTINGWCSIGADDVEALQRVAVDKTAPAHGIVSPGRAILQILLRTDSFGADDRS
jgi:hypothetical protein